MIFSSIKKLLPFFIFVFFIPGAPILALGPMYSFRDLVAGEGNGVLRDGPFYSAQFNEPSGLAVDPDQAKLYVADKGNHCIRMIYFSQQNQVSTVVGNGQAGFADGPFAQAQFKEPSLIVCLPGNRLAVVDQGNYRIRLVDLNKRKVFTLAGNGTPGEKDGLRLLAQIGSVCNASFLESQDAIYFTEPESGSLRRLILKTGLVKTVLKGDSRLPKPGSLCVKGDKLVVTDFEKNRGYELTPTFGKDEFKWSLFGCNSKTLGLAWSDGALYALQANLKIPLFRLFSNPGPVVVYSSWGLPLTHFGDELLIPETSLSHPMGLVCDSAAPGRIYLSEPHLNRIIAIRDLDQADLMKNETDSNGLMDFDYPTTKPPYVFRILFVGDSHLLHNDDVDGVSDQNRMNLIAKKLELNLNTLAVLEDGPKRFEVLTLAKNACLPLNLWAFSEAPTFARKYDVDQVLLLQEPLFDNLNIYFDRPLAVNHLPKKELDPEYLLKSDVNKKIDPLAKQLLDLCLKKKLAFFNKDGKVQFEDHDKIMGDSEIRPLLIELYTRPLRALRRKLLEIKVEKGTIPTMVSCYIPLGLPQPIPEEKFFWQGVMEGIGAPIIDLSDALKTLGLSYYPLSEESGLNHFNGHGHELFAFMIAEQLVKRKWVPMGTEEVKK